MKKVKEESAFKKKIKELKSTTRGKAILRLIKWVIFFLCLFIFCFISSLFTSNNEIVEDNTNETLNSTSTIETDINILLDNLKKANYDYQYNITLNEDKIIFKGTKTSEIDSGYKNTSSGSIIYTIDTTGIYEEKVNERVLITDLYENLNADYFDILKLTDILGNVGLEKVECNCINLTYEGTLDNINYNLKLDNENSYISCITISTTNITYEFNFSNVEVAS